MKKVILFEKAPGTVNFLKLRVMTTQMKIKNTFRLQSHCYYNVTLIHTIKQDGIP